MESKPVNLKEQNGPKQIYSCPANRKYRPRVLIASNNNVYRTIRKKIIAVFLRRKMSIVQEGTIAAELYYPISQFI